MRISVAWDDAWGLLYHPQCVEQRLWMGGRTGGCWWNLCPTSLPWGRAALGLPSLPPAPRAAPSCSQTASQTIYARCLYKQNYATPLSVFFVVFLEVGWDVFFSSFPLLFLYDLMTFVMHLNSFLF